MASHARDDVNLDDGRDPLVAGDPSSIRSMAAKIFLGRQLGI
jgi:hypothetical protein